MPGFFGNGTELHYETIGQGFPLVYVHGGFPSMALFLLTPPPDSWSWERVFAQHFYFVWYDRRGCYHSACPDNGYDLPNLARDLEAVLDHLQLDRVHLIGSSAGGPISVVFASWRPERVQSLVLTGTGLTLFPSDDPVTGIIQEQLSLLDQHGADYAFEHRPAGVEVSFGVLWEPAEMQVRGTLNEYQSKQQALNIQAAALSRVDRVRRYATELKAMRAYLEPGLHQLARDIQAPTLIIHGSEDQEVPLRWGEELAEIIPTSRLQVVDGGSHSLLIRDAVSRQQVIAFLQSQS